MKSVKELFIVENERYPSLFKLSKERTQLPPWKLRKEERLIVGLMFGSFALSVLFGFESFLGGFGMFFLSQAILWILLAKSRVQQYLDLFTQRAPYIRLGKCLEHNRLRHDLGEANVELLETTAGLYFRCAESLNRWEPAGASEESLRNRAKSGVASAMDRALAPYVSRLPDSPGPLPIQHHLANAADKFIFGKTTDSRGLDDDFHRARDVAEELAATAEELEKQATKGPALKKDTEATELRGILSELRQYRQAESELDEDVRH